MPWKEGVKVFCQVIVDIVHENVAKPFTYQIPDGMELMAGQRVAVPFGHMEKEGIVTALTTDTDVSPAKLRSVIRPLEEYAAIPPELIELAEDMALKSHCPLAETLRLMIPAQMRGGRVHIKTEKTVCLRVNREEAEAAGRKLGHVKMITEGYQDMTYANTSEKVYAGGMGAAEDSASAANILPGQAEITANVTVTYTLQ